MPPKTAAERAQEALDVAERRVKKLGAKRERLAAEHHAVMEELEAAEKRRDYLAQDPDLGKSFESSHKAEDDDAELGVAGRSRGDTEPEF